jgi:trehalose synthase
VLSRPTGSFAKKCPVSNSRSSARWHSTIQRGGRSTGRSARASGGDLDIHVFTNLTGVGNVEVNAFQRQADVVIQKSIREGFGLVVSETLWKGTPVVAAKAGGIPLQMAGDAGGFLVDSVEEAADRTLRLLRNPEEGRTLGARGKELVRGRFLLPRLLADELRLYASLIDHG